VFQPRLRHLLDFSFNPRFLRVLASDYSQRRYGLAYEISPMYRESLIAEPLDELFRRIPRVEENKLGLTAQAIARIAQQL
jgi:hypothetical protein